MINNQLNVVVANEADRQRWNDFVATTPTFGLLQSYEWGEVKENLGWKVVRLAVEHKAAIIAVAQVLIKPVLRGLFSVAYIPRGPLVDWEDRELTTTLLEAIHQEMRRYKVVFLRIEPPLLDSPEQHRLLESYGFQGASHTNQPRCSMIVNLPDNIDDLFKSFPSSTRYNIRLSQRKGVTVDIGTEEEVASLHQLMQITAERGDFSARSLDYYLNEWRTFVHLGRAQLFLARYKGETVTAQMPFRFGEHSATLHAGSLNEYRNLKTGYLTMWEAMCWAQRQGCRTFDLWGIPDEIGEYISRGEEIPQGKKGGLWGVYYFKRAFRGNIVYYVNAHDYPYASIPYHTFKAVTSQLGTLDSFTVPISDRSE